MKLELRSLRAINCGPLRDVCIHFNTEGEHPITVLAGANGSGKTTALELVFALFHLLSREVAPIFDGHSGVLGRVQYAQMDCRVDNERFCIFFGKAPVDVDLGDEFFGWHIAPLAPFVVQGKIADNMTSLIQAQRDAFVNFALTTHKLTTSSTTLAPSVLFFPHNRFLIPVVGQQLQREGTGYSWVHRNDSIYTFQGSLDSYLVWLDYAEPETFSIVIDFLNSLDFDGKTYSVRRKDLKAIVTTKAGNTHYLEELSSGEQSILITMIELRRRLLPGSIVLIDEIENSLHPAFQHRIAEGLMRLQETVPFQLIVTTHSPTFVDIFGTARTRILTEF